MVHVHVRPEATSIQDGGLGKRFFCFNCFFVFFWLFLEGGLKSVTFHGPGCARMRRVLLNISEIEKCHEKCHYGTTIPRILIFPANFAALICQCLRILACS